MRAVPLLLLLGGSLLAQTGARYLIVTHDNYFDAIQPLARWKEQIGLPCVVVKTSQIGSTADAIRNFIVGAYDTWSPRPEYVLLVGNAAQIPAVLRGTWPFTAWSDSRYGDMTDDYVAELPVGRFPCRSARQCSVMVARTIAYERWPSIEDTTWYRRGTTVLNDSSDSDSTLYWEDARYVAGFAAGAGYMSIDSLSARRQNNAMSVVRSVDSGTSFVMYRGHAVDYWFPPFDLRPYIAGLTNGPRWPVLCPFACQTLSLDIYPTDSMTGNTWIKVGTPQAPQGAVAVVGSTHDGIGMAGRRSAIARGYFRRLFSTESLPILGAATLAGKLQLYNEYHDSVDYYGFNIFGDPALNVWTTTPHPAEPEYDTVVPVGTDTLQVSVTRAGLPVHGALVCVRSHFRSDSLAGRDTASPQDTIYEYRYTDSAGVARLTFVTTEHESLELTVTGPNCIPFEGYVCTDTVPGTGVRDQGSVNRNPSPDPLSLVLDVRPSIGHGRFAIACWPGARIRVYGMAGRKIAEFVAPGPVGRLCWDGGNVATGAYVVRADDRRGHCVSRTVVETAR